METGSISKEEIRATFSLSNMFPTYGMLEIGVEWNRFNEQEVSCLPISLLVSFLQVSEVRFIT